MFPILDLIFILSVILFGLIALLSGLLLVFRSFLNFRMNIHRSMNMDLEIIRVSKINRSKEEQEKQESWKEEIGAMEQLLASLSNLKETSGWWKQLMYGQPHISFEIANSAKDEEIIFFVAMPKKFREAIEKQINSFFPNASLELSQDFNIFYPGSITCASILKLKNDYVFPIKTYENQEIDPLNALTNALSKLDRLEEGAAVQLVFRPVSPGWRSKGRKIAREMQQGKRLSQVHSKSFLEKAGKEVGNTLYETVIKSNKNGSGGSSDSKSFQLTPEEQELIKSIDQKSNKAGFEVNIRLVASSGSQERSQQILSQLENAFAQYENSDLNCFQVLKRFNQKDIAFDFIFRNFIPSQAMILNIEEIASIFHLPISVTEGPKIKWLKSNVAPPPVAIPQEGLILGFNDYRGVNTSIRMTDEDRRRHLYAIGQTGTGKSTFLQEMAKQDARNGKGFCFIDPHGDAVEDILKAIPKERAEDVIIFDPADVERPFGLNLLEYDQNHPEQKTFVINEMIGIFDQLYDLKATGGPMFEQYMRNAMLLIIRKPVQH
jgi:hypothetical protein